MHFFQLQGITNPSSKFTNPTTLPQDITSRVLLVAIVFVGFFFIFRIVTSGYLYLTSVGDPGKIQSATKNLINASIGLFLVLMAYFVAQILFSIVGLNNAVIFK